LIDFAFSEAALPLTFEESITSIDGMVKRRGISRKWVCVYRYRKKNFLRVKAR
jgi:hypothetical protein